MGERRDVKSWQGFSRADLHADSATVRYELEMLVGVERVLASGPLGDKLVRNALTESFAIHCRSLILFLFGHLNKIVVGGAFGISSRWSNDVVAWDFYPEWQVECPGATDTIVDAKQQADKHVAHIVTERRGVNQPGMQPTSVWEVGAITSEVCRVFAKFLDSAPRDNFRPEEFVRMKEVLRCRIQPSPLPTLSADLAVVKGVAGTTQTTTQSLSAATVSPNEAKSVDNNAVRESSGGTLSW